MEHRQGVCSHALTRPVCTHSNKAFPPCHITNSHGLSLSAPFSPTAAHRFLPASVSATPKPGRSRSRAKSGTRASWVVMATPGGAHTRSDATPLTPTPTQPRPVWRVGWGNQAGRWRGGKAMSQGRRNGQEPAPVQDHQERHPLGHPLAHSSATVLSHKALTAGHASLLPRTRDCHVSAAALPAVTRHLHIRGHKARPALQPLSAAQRRGQLSAGVQRIPAAPREAGRVGSWDWLGSWAAGGMHLRLSQGPRHAATL